MESPAPSKRLTRLPTLESDGFLFCALLQPHVHSRSCFSIRSRAPSRHPEVLRHASYAAFFWDPLAMRQELRLNPLDHPQSVTGRPPRSYRPRPSVLSVPPA